MGGRDTLQLRGQGVRLADTQALARDRVASAVFRVLHLSFKATRYITEHFLKTSRDLHDPCKENCSIDFVLGETSQATVAIQYLSFLCSGKADCLRILWQVEGCLSFADFVLKKPVVAKRARVAFYCASGGIHSAIIATRDKGANKLLILSDARQPMSVRTDIAVDLCTELNRAVQGRVALLGNIIFSKVLFLKLFQRIFF